MKTIKKRRVQLKKINKNKVFVPLICCMFWVIPLFGYQVEFPDNTIEPGDGKVNATMYIQNTSNNFLAVEVTPKNWDRAKGKVNGKDVLSETTDLFIMPSQLILPPRSQQSVSISWASNEVVKTTKCYRLIVEPIPIPFEQEKDTKVIQTQFKYIKSFYALPGEKFTSVELISIDEIKNEEKVVLLLHLKIQEL